MELRDGGRSPDNLPFRVFRVKEDARPLETAQESPHRKQHITALSETVETVQVFGRSVRTHLTKSEINRQGACGKHSVGGFERGPGPLPVVVDIGNQASTLQGSKARRKVFSRHPVHWPNTLQTSERNVLFEVLLRVMRQPDHTTVACVFGHVPEQFPEIMGTHLKALLIRIAKIQKAMTIHGKRLSANMADVNKISHSGCLFRPHNGQINGMTALASIPTDRLSGTPTGMKSVHRSFAPFPARILPRNLAMRDIRVADFFAALRLIT